MELSEAQFERYARHLVLDEVGEEGQQKLLQSRVLVIGAGGLGSPLLLYLAAAGVGALGVVDNDTVDLSNLQRQTIFTTDDIGAHKAVAAAEFIRRLNPNVVVEEHVTRIDDECAPDWPYPPEGRGCHRVLVKGSPDLTVSIHADDRHELGAAGGGNATAANRIVNAIPAVCAAKPGIVTALDLPPISGARQLN